MSKSNILKKSLCLVLALVLAGIYCVNILHSIYTARRQAAAEQKEQTV